MSVITTKMLTCDRCEAQEQLNEGQAQPAGWFGLDVVTPPLVPDTTPEDRIHLCPSCKQVFDIFLSEV